MSVKNSTKTRKYGLIVLAFLLIVWLLFRCTQQSYNLGAREDKPVSNTERTDARPQNRNTSSEQNTKWKEKSFPAEAYTVVKYANTHNGKAMPGYKGNTYFGNREKKLPITNAIGIRLEYKEYDIYPWRKGINRGPKRVVIASDGKAYYTKNHYRTFAKIEE